ncbi:hypothetical protein HF1_08900 [Mycoplasma haemofelis str. Langford 1]|uniref:Lipoprotein n=1 Tax=Mycoplasma haemofelis (strain Langford 1) TaxID=941640 RepID=E8ZIC7_MYCHL|nr:hypothetical protein [Mycoplasma haemofelis]CBY92898.1 hypothetical protein HF1_08900 [Mycoplasma haemofelis str. Langford 1]
MSKLVLPLAGIGGASVAAAGGYMVFGRDNKSITPKVEETFKSKYSQAILSDNSDLWASKLEALKGNGNPVHQKLAEAKKKAQSETKGAEPSQAKQLLIDGCKEIYESKLKDSPYAQDFKSYCAKTIKDGITGTWLAGGHTGSGTKWDQGLTNLKSQNNDNLDSLLKDLKGKLPSDSGTTTFDDSHRQSLKDWCETSQKEIFMGETDPRFINSKSYCLEATQASPQPA